jgi:hypothetical protein
LKRTGEDKLVLLKSSLESGDELATKDTTEYAHRQEEGIAGMDPAFTVGSKTSGGDYTMEVRMKTPTPTVP